MASATITIRGMGGTKTVTIESDEPITAGSLREAAEIAEGIVLRHNGETLEDDALVSDGSTVISAPAQAKHGRATA